MIILLYVSWNSTVTRYISLGLVQWLTEQVLEWLRKNLLVQEQRYTKYLTVKLIFTQVTDQYDSILE